VVFLYDDDGGGWGGGGGGGGGGVNRINNSLEQSAIVIIKDLAACISICLLLHALKLKTQLKLLKIFSNEKFAICEVI